MDHAIIGMLYQDEFTEKDRLLSAYAWPGGYPVFYLMGDGEPMCPACVNKEIKRLVDEALDSTFSDNSWCVIGRDINWEDSSMICCHCNKPIESAYGNSEVMGR
jgi:hypothetical protein